MGFDEQARGGTLANKMWTADRSVEWLKRTTAFGVLGVYTHVEVTEVVAYRDDEPKTPINVFSIAVLEARLADSSTRPAFLHGKDRVRLRSLNGWAFGVVRYVTELACLVPSYETFSSQSVWNLGGVPLRIGDMMAVAPQFVPPDSSESTPLNRMLKNNFWSGSYILELFDISKSNLGVFLEKPQRLQELSDRVQERVPLQLASLADRLGNIVLQLPCTSLLGTFRMTDDGFSVEVAWHPQVTPRPLRAVTSMEFDGAVCGYGSVPLNSSTANLNTRDNSGGSKHLIWDESNELILAATSTTYYVHQVGIKPSINVPEPRVFNCVEDDGSLSSKRVALRMSLPKQLVGESSQHTFREWTHKRIYKDEQTRLEQTRHFVQYRPDPGNPVASRRKAIDDIRFLIDQYGKGGVWLWDPYLSARDLLDTLFHCRHSGAPMRALTDGMEPRERASPKDVGAPMKAYFRRKAKRQEAARAGRTGPVKTFIDDQRAALSRAGGNLQGLVLEYRIRTGQTGLKFHDRFLIFPRPDETPLAWSLGTSVNGAGKAHHILQRVDNGRLILDAFAELWDQLAGSRHLIWKTP
ncbi:VPA1262 family N-terminal domain-containing protein [Burkholderia plantarii]|uniref:VPA1262 family N-terminal domain-containing protein n=1 Tax=Burkholderia plantarii TaxID=41899 RepID=UPI000F50BBDC|nr:VPA1262 family N-terminal domain-containing protein [Burkholderia plantarii]